VKNERSVLFLSYLHALVWYSWTAWDIDSDVPIPLLETNTDTDTLK